MSIFTFRPHQCFVCGKTFVMNGDLTSHMRKHTKTEPTIPCTICWKMFERPGQLSEHMRLHTNERPFECKICGSRFRTKGYFNIHKTTHWIGRNFACELCGVTFKNPTGVRTHMFKVHGKNAATSRRQKKKDEQ
ncbi:Zinc finger protein [Pseudolycoriella hygida]|uniref:Zinc finger protein n=1 Tax=Pseudolycoriella hygida TaxID=35572 RepID=A0A9Q0N0K2_9DIPT|nr:Zinc finger protein [Pseudolycoriella hygida]